MTDRTLPVTGLDHCGNSPRMATTAELVVAWSQADESTLAPWFADDVSHTVAGPSPARACHGAAETPGRSARLAA